MEIRDRRDQPWFWIPNDLIDRYGERLGPYGLAIYMALARYSDNISQAAVPSVKTLAKKVGISANKAREMLQLLKDLSLIEIASRWTPEGDQTTNAYTLLPLPKEQPPDGKEELHAIENGYSREWRTGTAPGGGQVLHPVEPLEKTHIEQDLSELSNSIVHAPTNGNARTQEKDWPVEFQDVKKVLTDLEILPPFNDPAYWKAIETWTDTCGFPIYYLDELRAYHAYQIALPPGGKNKHRDMKKGFRTWIANAINFRRRDAERKASWEQRR